MTTSSSLRLLDLFCGAGGCSMGYSRAGFEVVGVDLEPQPNYPFEFVQADATTFPLDGFDAIHASPPCQAYSRALKHMALPTEELIDPIRQRLVASGVPWVIEGVVDSPLKGIVLCGTSFGLRVYRHRLFEASVPIVAPRCTHRGPAMNPHKQMGRNLIYEGFGRCDPEGPWREEMGVEWMSRYEGREAIPPVFTEYIGRQLVASL